MRELQEFVKRFKLYIPAITKVSIHWLWKTLMVLFTKGMIKKIDFNILKSNPSVSQNEFLESGLLGEKELPTLV